MCYYLKLPICCRTLWHLQVHRHGFVTVGATTGRGCDATSTSLGGVELSRGIQPARRIQSAPRLTPRLPSLPRSHNTTTGINRRAEILRCSQDSTLPNDNGLHIRVRGGPRTRTPGGPRTRSRGRRVSRRANRPLHGQRKRQAKVRSDSL